MKVANKPFLGMEAVGCLLDKQRVRTIPLRLRDLP